MSMILAIDPGSHRSGWATETESGVMVEPKAMDMLALVTAHRPTVMVIESQYLGPHCAVMPLIKCRYTWEAMAEMQGARVVHVDPPRWQKHFGIVAPKGCTGTKRKKWIKDAIMQLATVKAYEVGRDKPQPDEADAILILAWAQDAEKLGCMS